MRGTETIFSGAAGGRLEGSKAASKRAGGGDASRWSGGADVDPPGSCLISNM